jgi:hypothetical protein
LKKHIFLFGAGVFFAACIGIAAIKLHNPSQDLVMTGYNKTRPLFLRGDGSDCIDKLRQSRVTFTPKGDQIDGHCVIKNAVRVTAFSKTKINSPVLLSCPAALVTDNWLRDIDAADLEHIGAYNCRTQRNNKLMSEHSYGTAMDIVTLNGAKIIEDWGASTSKGRYLNGAFTSACQHFSNVIGPDDNHLHKGHLHVDTGLGFGCTFKPLKQYLIEFVEKITAQ